jgi:hypothetical protein
MPPLALRLGRIADSDSERGPRLGRAYQEAVSLGDVWLVFVIGAGQPRLFVEWLVTELMK